MKIGVYIQAFETTTGTQMPTLTGLPETDEPMSAIVEPCPRARISFYPN